MQADMTAHISPSTYTSERVDMDHYRADPGLYMIYLRHFVAYEWFCAEAAGKDVLDFGAGTGHGSAQLAGVARSVTGVDVSDEAVAASRRAFQHNNLSFETIKPVEEEPLRFADGSFDVVVSNQVIEHVPDARGYLAECHRVLRPGGVVFVVTPDRTIRLYGWQKPWNRHHLHEFSPGELGTLVGEKFAEVSLHGTTARADVLAREDARTLMLRRATLPFTLPGLPEAWRQGGLGLLQRLNARRAGTPSAIDFGPEDVWITPDAKAGMDVCVRAVRRG
ncbi:class I SAM-dependent methyltransferase [Marimonas sp. MJW-29]|uniref:Class I SAM-dependent methyltransferase n=1 Tax=Sulfitobacter sediminis TaxID=3234186 RepID=A0ABV3RT56_9RHOB